MLWLGVSLVFLLLPSASGVLALLLIFFMLIFSLSDLGTMYTTMSLTFSWSWSSTLLMWMSFWLTAATVLSSKKSLVFENLSITLLAVVLLAFSTSNFLSFYFFFESSLIPIVTMVIFWGYQPERLQAVNYIIFYTLTASLPLMFLLIILSHYNGHSIMGLMSVLEGGPSTLMAVVLVAAFLVKCPMYYLHYWLPKAHVEASTAGSMFLAGILLKLGSYGLMKSMLLIGHKLGNLMLLGFMGGFTAAVSMMLYYDTKVYVAFSSIHHMGMIIGALASGLNLGVSGAVLVMVSHGLISPLMFMMSGLLYDKNKTRNLIPSKGTGVFFPAALMLFFFGCMMNMSIPPFITLVGEVLVMVVLTSVSVACAFSLIFLSCLYNIMLGAGMYHGQGMDQPMVEDMPAEQLLKYLLLSLPTLLLILKPALFMVC